MDSVHTGTDAQLLTEAIPFYLRYTPPRGIAILDATWGDGTMWRSTPYEPTLISIDSNTSLRPLCIADNRHMPFLASVFHVIVYDPPHVTHGWSEWDESSQYGHAVGRASISYLFPLFITEAMRVLRPNGIVLAKLSDQIHSGRTWLQSHEFITMAQQASFAVCDIIVKVRPAARPQPAYRQQLHAARRHSYWIVLRKGRC